jgi:hypothetical protein
MAEYEKTLLVYLDIMGFKKMVEDSQRDYSKVDEIIDMLKKVKARTSMSFKRVITSRMSADSMTPRDFSDLVVRITTLGLNPTEHKRFISDEFFMLAAIQCELFLESGILLRGAMCIDDLYLEKDIVFGPALVKAYEFEKSIAVFPRIVVDPKSCLLHEESGFARMVSAGILQRGDDGAYFIDYLHFSYFSMFVMSEFKKHETQMLERHKMQVETKLKELAGQDERVKQKSLWLALYHNSVLKRLIVENPGKMEMFMELLISEKQLEI